jgi:hypothetical protein
VLRSQAPSGIGEAGPPVMLEHRCLPFGARHWVATDSSESGRDVPETDHLRVTRNRSRGLPRDLLGVRFGSFGMRARRGNGRPGLSQTCDDRRQSTDPGRLRGGWAERMRGSLRAASEPSRRGLSFGTAPASASRSQTSRELAYRATLGWRRTPGRLGTVVVERLSLTGWSAPCARQTSERIDPKPMGASGRTGWQRLDPATDSPVEEGPEVEEAKDEAVATRTGLRRSQRREGMPLGERAAFERRRPR